jgi:hypothetical protein
MDVGDRERGVGDTVCAILLTLMARALLLISPIVKEHISFSHVLLYTVKNGRNIAKQHSGEEILSSSFRLLNIQRVCCCCLFTVEQINHWVH